MLNKYYPPDFDPAKLPRGKRPEHNSMKVRMMLPMSVQCQTCGTFMYKGTKFNMKKEDVDNETYLGIQARCCSLQLCSHAQLCCTASQPLVAAGMSSLCTQQSGLKPTSRRRSSASTGAAARARQRSR